MKIQTILLSIIMLGFVVAVSGCTNNSTPTATNSNTANNQVAVTTPSGSTQNSGSQKLSDSRYANSAYLISGDTLDAATKIALSGFNIDKTMNSDGSTTFKLTSTNPEYTDQTYTLQPGQKLYFIETSLRDDNDNNEGNLGDDSALITDANDNIIQGP